MYNKPDTASKGVRNMTNLLLRLFVKNYRDTKNPKVRAAYGKLAGAAGTALS